VNKLNITNIKNNLSYSNGYIYMGFYSNNLDKIIEKLSQFVYLNKIFDVITWSDLFQIENSCCKAIQGTGFLKYYLSNTKICSISNDSNGIVTL